MYRQFELKYNSLYAMLVKQILQRLDYRKNRSIQKYIAMNE